MLAPIATVSFVFMFGALTAHAQTGTSGAPGTTGTGATGSVYATSGPAYATSTTGNTNSSGYGGTSTATTAPGTPNTGAGANAPVNIALLGASGLLAIVGASYLFRARAHERVR